MLNVKFDCDLTEVVGIFLVFALPLTLLIPDFSIWNLIPKIRITRFLIVSQHLSWPQINATLIGLLSLFFCICLEIRKRKIDDMIETVMAVGKITDATLEMEKEGHAAAMKVCAELLNNSSEHYEHLTLLRDELNSLLRQDEALKQSPATIEPSSSI